MTIGLISSMLKATQQARIDNESEVDLPLGRQSTERRGVCCRSRIESNFQLSYDVAVEKRLICHEIIDPQNEILWEKEIVEPEIDVVEVTSREAGWNYIVIQCDKAKGSFEVDWQAE